MNVVSLCSGVGLLDLGLEWAGMRTVQFCEIDPYAVRVLEVRYPGVPVHDDVWTIEPKECDVIAAGFPCQPFSVAGKRLGDRDPRHLWPAIIRSIRMARPRFVILENVPGLVTAGLGDVLGDLADAGYDAEWTVFSAADVGAPHLRKRWWCVATSDPDSSAVWDESGGFFRPGWGDQAVAWAHGRARPLADTGRAGLEGHDVTEPPFDELAGRCSAVADPEGEPIRAGLRENEPGGQRGRRPRNSGSPNRWWATEPDVGRVADGVPLRMDRLRCLGNGVVPQCAELIGLRLVQLGGDA